MVVAIARRFTGTLLREPHLLSERVVRLPLATGQGCGLFEHLIDLFEGEAFRLWDKEECKQEAEKQCPAPDEEYLYPQVTLILVHDVGSDDGDHAIPKPVGCGRQGDALGPNWEGEEFADHDPRSGTPGRCKSCNVETCEYDETDITGCSLSARANLWRRRQYLRCMPTATRDSHDGNDEFADTHDRRPV